MSCKKKYRLQLTHLLFFTLSIIYFISACSKDQPLIDSNTSPLPEKEEIPNFILSKNNIQFETESIELKNTKLAIELKKDIRDLVINTFFETYFFPELRGLTGSVVDTRNPCPEATLFPGSSIDTLQLNYQDCTTLSDVRYNGIINVIIDGPLESPGTTVLIDIFPDFIINGNRYFGGFMELEYDSLLGNTTYNATLVDLVSTHTFNFGTTTVTSDFPTGKGGTLKVIENGTNITPLDLLDDLFIYDAANLYIHCPDGTELIGSMNTELEFDILCGLPHQGEVDLQRIRPNGSTTFYGTIDFGYPFSPIPGACDSEVAIYLADDPLVPVIINY